MKPRPLHAALAVIILVPSQPASLRAEEPVQLSPEHTAFFESKIRPVLAEQCYSCHSAEAEAKGKLKAGLFVDSPQGLLAGGETGPAFVTGKPEESLLIKLIRHQVKDAEMPPKGKLPDSVIADFAKWIELGAPDPRPALATSAKTKRVIDVAAGKDWWAFKPLTLPAVPAVANPTWGSTPVDAFILAKLETAGLTPNPLASREKLLRRVTFDLTGLAPTSEERTAFLKDESPDAYAKLIDRLLGSTAYGERWGRHWLDVVRFAESAGYEFDNFRPGAYHYRDWVIKALNDDMPYDVFVSMQVAGDQLKPNSYEGASAAGFLVAGPYPGQITAKTEEKIRYDQLDDMVSTIGSGLLGLTMACVRCHDHKFDPLLQRDYYGIAAALANTVHASSMIEIDPAETQRKLEAYNQALAPLLEAVKKFETEELPKRFDDWRRDQLPHLKSDTPWQTFGIQSATAQHAALTSDRNGLVLYAGNKTNDDTYTIRVVTHQKGVRAFRLDALSDPSLPSKGPGLSDNGNFVLGDVKITAKPVDANLKIEPVPLKLKASKASFGQSGYEFEKSVDADPGTGWGVAPEMGKDHVAVFAIDGAGVGFEGGTEFEIQLRFSGFFGLGRFRLAFSNGGDEARLGDAEDMQNLRELQVLTEASASPAGLLRWFSHFDEQMQKLSAAVTDHGKSKPQPTLTEVYTTTNGGQDVFFLRRGEVDRKEGKASPNFVQVLMRSGDAEKKWVPAPDAAQPAVHPRTSLANWMTDADAGAGPLLARVMVNRLWRQHFGQGLVSSSNDFGSQGERPTHPELLDWLASEFVKGGWRLKPLHRLILLSSVYKQSGEINAAAAGRDPDNHLWARRPARRLEAEAIRDALLQLGGKLDAKIYGPSESNNESGRRSVYLRVKRSELVPFMTMFDAPEPNQSVGDRGNTTVPTQALAVMNSAFVQDLAAEFLKRIMATEPAGNEAVISKAYELALGRLPEPQEIQRMSAFIDQQRQLLGEKPDARNQALHAFCHALLCLNEFIYID